MPSDSASERPKHRSPKRRWWQRSEPAVPEPAWVPGWASDWHVVEPGAERAETEA